MQDDVQPDLLNVKHVARAYGKSVNTIWVWSRKAKSPNRHASVARHYGAGNRWSRTSMVAALKWGRLALWGESNDAHSTSALGHPERSPANFGNR